MDTSALPRSPVTLHSSDRYASLGTRFKQVRDATESLCEFMHPEDYVVQSMEDASPTKWHLAHTTWFFETFVLAHADPAYRPFHPEFAYLFNSYYVQAGERWQRPYRGLLSRPTVEEVYAYRAYVNEAMHRLLEVGLSQLPQEKQHSLHTRIEIGLNHEQQHQELLLTDAKHLFSINPLRPAFHPDAASAAAATSSPVPLNWVSFEETISSIGHNEDSFFYDNEKPFHRELIPAFDLASRTVTSDEFLEFMNDGGYRRPELWLSLGWAAVEAGKWEAPMYWEPVEKNQPAAQTTRADQWQTFTLGGMRPVDGHGPLTHISYFEADAYARWKGCTLPTEFMWEHACRAADCSPEHGNFVESRQLHPVAAPAGPGLQQMLGNLWEWTASPYTAYPGYQAPPGALGEYNGKFMCNQIVLRGGSCATPQSHIRPGYRNFFPPAARWQFSGIRLARYRDL